MGPSRAQASWTKAGVRADQASSGAEQGSGLEAEPRGSSRSYESTCPAKPTGAENQECGLLRAEHGPPFSSSVTSSTFHVSGRGQHWGPDEDNSSEAITRKAEP